MKKTSTKVLSVALSLVLAVGMVPSAAWAKAGAATAKADDVATQVDKAADTAVAAGGSVAAEAAADAAGDTADPAADTATSENLAEMLGLDPSLVIVEASTTVEGPADEAAQAMPVDPVTKDTTNATISGTFSKSGISSCTNSSAYPWKVGRPSTSAAVYSQVPSTSDCFMSGNADTEGTGTTKSTFSKLTISFLADSQISFKYGVDSETNYDKGHIVLFYADGSNSYTYSPISGQTGDAYRFSRSVNAGERLEITYKKDDSGTKGDDAMFIWDVSITAGHYCGANLQWKIANDTLTIYGTGAMNDYNNTDDAPWYGQTGFSKVVIQEGVTTIGANAFWHSNYEYSCEYFKSVSLPSTITSIGQGAFANQSNMAIVGSLPANLKTIGDKAFRYCSAITGTLTLPSKLETIGKEAFYSVGISAVYIPASVVTIGDYAFYDSSKLTDVQLAPNSKLANMGVAVFPNGANNFVALNTAGTAYYARDTTGGVTVSGTGALDDTYAWASVIDPVKSKITKVTIGDGITDIPAAGFQNCTNLLTVTIGSGVKTIGNVAFDHCSSLSSVTIRGNALTSVGSDAFKETAVVAVRYGGTVDKWMNIDFTDEGSNPCNHGANLLIGGQAIGGLTVPVTATSVKPYVMCGVNNLTSVSVPASVTSIGKGAFKNCTALTKVTFNSGSALTTIGTSAFNGCRDLTSVTIPSKVKTIGSYAFYKCKRLATVTMSSTVLTSIGSYAFSCCENLISFTIPATVTTIGQGAFYLSKSISTVKYKGTAAKYVKLFFGSETANPCSYGSKLYIDGALVTDFTVPSSVVRCNTYLFAGVTSLTSVSIPSVVATVGSMAFKNCVNLTKVSFTGTPTVYQIESSAFEGCRSLTSFTLPASVKTLGAKAFKGCRKLATFTIKSGSKLKTVSDYAFQNCSALKSISLPGTVSSLGSAAFQGCAAITTVSASSCTFTRIQPDTFSGCLSLATVSLPSVLSTVNSNAFMDCISLTSAKFAGSVTKWLRITFDTDMSNPCYYGAALYCEGSKVTSVSVPTSITEIKPYAFIGCSSIAKVTIAREVTKIGLEAFKNCTALTSCAFSTSTSSSSTKSELTEIGQSAFENCTALSSFTAPKYLHTIGSKAFYGCNHLLKVTFSDTSKLETIGQQAFMNCTRLGYVNIPKLVTTISKEAFRNCRSLLLINLTDSITEVGDYAFAGCSSLATVNLPAYLDTINLGAFMGCTSLAGVKLPGTIKTIDANAFNGCASLTSITIPKFAVTIGASAFARCTSLASVSYAGYNVRELGEGAFEGCISLTEAKIPSKCAKVGSGVFEGCISVTSATIPARVVEMGNNVYRGCTKLAKVEYSADSQLTEIGTEMFGGCIKLTSVVFPKLCTLIGEKAFQGCTAMTAITIPNTVTEIAASAFADCTKLATLKFAATSHVELIGAEAFLGCKALKKVSLPKSIQSIGAKAFGSTSSATCATVHVKNLLKASGFTGTATVSENTTIASGSCGTSVKWYLRASGTLVIKGTGAMKTYSMSSLAPWYAHRAAITKVIIADGVTSVGAYAFVGMTKIASVVIPTTVKTIGTAAFKACASLKTVTVPKSVTKINSSAFELLAPSSIIYVTSTTVGSLLKGKYSTDRTRVLTKKAMTSVTLSKTTIAYTGKKAVPTVTVKNGTTKLTAGTSYTVTYLNTYGNVVESPIAKGTYTVLVTGKGSYAGTLTKTFTIS